MSFCYRCGTKEVPKWKGTYSEETGEKVMHNVCPNWKGCWIGCEAADMESVPFFSLTMRCRSCGQTHPTMCM